PSFPTRRSSDLTGLYCFHAGITLYKDCSGRVAQAVEADIPKSIPLDKLPPAVRWRAVIIWLASTSMPNILTIMRFPHIAYLQVFFFPFELKLLQFFHIPFRHVDNTNNLIFRCVRFKGLPTLGS